MNIDRISKALKEWNLVNPNSDNLYSLKFVKTFFLFVNFTYYCILKLAFLLKSY